MIFVRNVFDHNSGSSISFNLKLLVNIYKYYYEIINYLYYIINKYCARYFGRYFGRYSGRYSGWSDYLFDTKKRKYITILYMFKII